MLNVRSHSSRVVDQEAAAAADAGVVEQQMDAVAVLLLRLPRRRNAGPAVSFGHVGDVAW